MDLKSTYNKIAEDWATDHAADTWWIEGTDKFCSLLKLGATILDVGCGAGFKSKYLTDKGFKVLGTDFSEKMIEAARKKYPSLESAVADMYEIDKIGRKFDAVFVQAALLHIPKDKVMEVLNKMKGLLNKGGLLYIAVKEKKEGGAGEEIKKENDYGYDYERFFSYFTMPELRSYLNSLRMESVWETITNNGRTNWLQIVGKDKSRSRLVV